MPRPPKLPPWQQALLMLRHTPSQPPLRRTAKRLLTRTSRGSARARLQAAAHAHRVHTDALRVHRRRLQSPQAPGRAPGPVRVCKLSAHMPLSRLWAVRPAPAWRRSASPGLLEGGGLLVRLYTCPESGSTRAPVTRERQAAASSVHTTTQSRPGAAMKGSHCMNALSATLRAHWEAWAGAWLVQHLMTGRERGRAGAQVAVEPSLARACAGLPHDRGSALSMRAPAQLQLTPGQASHPGRTPAHTQRAA